VEAELVSFSSLWSSFCWSADISFLAAKTMAAAKSENLRRLAGEDRIYLPKQRQENKK
jgi:hypothetical protein